MTLTLSEVEMLLKVYARSDNFNQNLVNKLESYRYRLTRP